MNKNAVRYHKHIGMYFINKYIRYFPSFEQMQVIWFFLFILCFGGDVWKLQVVIILNLQKCPGPRPSLPVPHPCSAWLLLSLFILLLHKYYDFACLAQFSFWERILHAQGHHASLWYPVKEMSYPFQNRLCIPKQELNEFTTVIAKLE